MILLGAEMTLPIPLGTGWGTQERDVTLTEAPCAAEGADLTPSSRGSTTS